MTHLLTHQMHSNSSNHTSRELKFTNHSVSLFEVVLLTDIFPARESIQTAVTLSEALEFVSIGEKEVHGGIMGTKLQVILLNHQRTHIQNFVSFTQRLLKVRVVGIQEASLSKTSLPPLAESRSVANTTEAGVVSSW